MHIKVDAKIKYCHFVFHIAVIQMQNENDIACQPHGGFSRIINEYLQDSEYCVDTYSNR